MTSNVENMPPTSTPDPDQIKPSKQKTKSVSSDRKKLQTLQPSGKNQKLLVGSFGFRFTAVISILMSAGRV